MLEPYYSYWDIAESNYGIIFLNGAPWRLGVEPKNTTKVFGVRVSTQF